jgi:flagellar biosynthesis protein FliP
MNIELAGGNGASVATGVQLMVLLTALSLAPAALITMTAFTRIIIVLSLVRSAIGIPTLPPNQVLLGLTLFLTIFVMAPVWTSINTDAVQPYLSGTVNEEVAIHSAESPIRDFMFKQVREKDLSLFLNLAKLPQPGSPSDVPTHVLIPSFAMSELKSAFQMGFAIFIPFLVIDLVVSSILMSMGMMMLPPVVISLPFKLLLFVMVDGWFLLAQGLVSSFAI